MEQVVDKAQYHLTAIDAHENGYMHDAGCKALGVETFIEFVRHIKAEEHTHGHILRVVRIDAAPEIKQGAFTQMTQACAKMVRAAAVPGAYELQCGHLDATHNRRADGGRYPAPGIQVAIGLTGPITTALQSHPEERGHRPRRRQLPGRVGLSVHELQREVARRRATDEWRRMGARSFDDAYGMYLHDVRARWTGVFWASWAALMRNRAVCVGRADASMLRVGGGVQQPGRRGGAYPGVLPTAARGALPRWPQGWG